MRLAPTRPSMASPMHTTQKQEAGSPSQGALEAAVARAVSESLGVVAGLQAQVDAALGALEGVTVRARTGVGADKSASEVVETFWRELQSSRAEAADLFERQRKVLGTVNVALFGRTGTGKSSLIEALVRGDGATVSTSESDFTTEVRAVSWHGCQFIDTPGTNGWGRSASRETLEGRARQAVEVADIVVLCFDTQSQQRGEFEKIGAWVKEYGKPVVAVLNVRNPFWRRPSDVHLGTQRRLLSGAVREHVTNIDTELAALGIFGAPVVAISAQRAVYGRVTGPYRGPATEQFNNLCRDLGQDALLRASNFEVLEAVFVDALAHHASELRLGMLHAQVRSLLERLTRALQRANEDAKTAAGILDRAIEGLFAVVGYPVTGSSARRKLLSEAGARVLECMGCRQKNRIPSGKSESVALCGQCKVSLADASELVKCTSCSAMNRIAATAIRLLGNVPRCGKCRAALWGSHHDEDLLTWVERARGGPYETKAQGKLARFAQQRLEAEIGALRARSLSAAEEAVVRAFEERRDLDSDEFSKAVFQQGQIQAACERVAKDAAAFVRRETQLVIDDAKLDLNFAFGAKPAVAGTTGKTRREVGYGSGVAGVALGGASAWLLKSSLAAALVPGGQPAAIALGLASLATGIASMVAGWFRGTQIKKAEEARQRAWAEAIAAARRNVNDLYDGFAKQVSNTAAAMALDATVRLLTDPLSRAGALWMLVAEGSQAVSNLGQLRAQLPASTDAQGVLKVVTAAISARLHGADDAGPTLTLLGESWIRDPEGLVAEEGTSEAVRSSAYDPSFFQHLFEGFRTFVDRFGESIERGSGTRWLRDTEQALAEDAAASQSVAELNALAARGRARLQLFGDYSAGKTSFVRRLLIDGGLPLPDSLEVRADPTTDRIHVYEWEDVDVIDTPGLQSTKDAHGRVALAAYPDASAIIYLLQPNLLVGSTDAIERVLKGDRAAGLAPKLDRTIFVIHRSDELGADPEVVPDEYVRLCERKKTELQQALLSRGIRVADDRVFCMSADPYQLVGDRRDVSSDQFDRFRSWDGFAEFRKTIREVNVRFSNAGVDRSILEGGLARLGMLDGAAQQRVNDITERAGALSRLGVVLAESVAEGERIEGELRARARRMVDDHAFGNLERVAGAASDDELEATAKQLAGWWKLPAFEADAERWQAEAKVSIDDWFQRSADLLERTVSAPRFKAAVAGAGGSFDPSAFAGPAQGGFGKIMSLVAQPLKGATRDVVYSVGKALGATFPPWGAVKLARLLGRVGVVLGVVATVFDAVNLYRAWKGEKRRAELRKDLRGFVEETAAQVLQSLTEGNEEASGPMTYLKAVQDHLRSAAKDLDGDRARLLAQTAELDTRRGVYRARMALAWTTLGIGEVTA